MKIQLVAASFLSLVVGFSAGALYTNHKTETLAVSPEVTFIAPAPVEPAIPVSLQKSSETPVAIPALLAPAPVKKVPAIKAPVSPATSTAPKQHAQVQTCQWPHKCAESVIAQVQTCVWPHTCSSHQS